jgi:thermostable 8-oxoguanine DNA glycosylase
VILLNFSQTQRAKNLASFAPIFQKTYISHPNFRKQFKDDEVSNYIALEFFLTHFAYARQGSAKAYPVIAKQTIQEVFHGSLKTINSNQPTEAWKTYTDIAKRDFNSQETNEKRNPMNCNNGVLKVMAVNEVTNIANHVKTLIEHGETKKAHEFIDNITGIGPKIASLYLRDIACLANLESQIAYEDQFYLQPMDTWLIQALSIIKEKPVNPKNNKEKQDAQKTIVDLCTQAKCSPIEFKQGAWLAGSQIAGEYNTFKKIIFGEETKKILKNYVEEHRNYIPEIEKLMIKM